MAATPVRLKLEQERLRGIEIERRIEDTIAECCGLIVVVGDVAHSRKWTSFELSTAKLRGLPVVGIRHPDRSGGTPLDHKGLAFVDWSPEEVAAHIANWPALPRVAWQQLADDLYYTCRARVPGGWLVALMGEGCGSPGVTFIPDKDHSW